MHACTSVKLAGNSGIKPVYNGCVWSTRLNGKIKGRRRPPMRCNLLQTRKFRMGPRWDLETISFAYNYYYYWLFFIERSLPCWFLRCYGLRVRCLVVPIIFTRLSYNYYSFSSVIGRFQILKVISVRSISLRF